MLAPVRVNVTGPSLIRSGWTPPRSVAHQRFYLHQPGGRLQRKALCDLPVWPPSPASSTAVAVRWFGAGMIGVAIDLHE